MFATWPKIHFKLLKIASTQPKPDMSKVNWRATKSEIARGLQRMLDDPTTRPVTKLMIEDDKARMIRNNEWEPEYNAPLLNV